MGQCFGDAVAVRLGAGKSSLVSDVFLDIAHGIARAGNHRGDVQGEHFSVIVAIADGKNALARNLP